MTDKIENARKVGFTRGVVYAIAELLRYGDQSYAEELWIQSGFKIEDLKVCDSYDSKPVRKMARQLVVNKRPRIRKGELE